LVGKALVRLIATLSAEQRAAIASGYSLHSAELSDEAQQALVEMVWVEPLRQMAQSAVSVPGTEVNISLRLVAYARVPVAEDGPAEARAPSPKARPASPPSGQRRPLAKEQSAQVLAAYEGWLAANPDLRSPPDVQANLGTAPDQAVVLSDVHTVADLIDTVQAASGLLITVPDEFLAWSAALSAHEWRLPLLLEALSSATGLAYSITADGARYYESVAWIPPCVLAQGELSDAASQWGPALVGAQAWGRWTELGETGPAEQECLLDLFPELAAPGGAEAHVTVLPGVAIRLGLRGETASMSPAEDAAGVEPMRLVAWGHSLTAGVRLRTPDMAALVSELSAGLDLIPPAPTGDEG
jgi:hypothetical protein